MYFRYNPHMILLYLRHQRSFFKGEIYSACDPIHLMGTITSSIAEILA